MRSFASTAAAVLLATTATSAWAQDAVGEEAIVVTAQRANQTQVDRGGQVGILGDKDAADVPFNIRSYSEALILNQQPQTLGQLLENDPAIRITYAYGNPAEVFIIRGFPLYSDDVGLNGLYGIAPRQLIAPELYQSVQVLNGASAFLNGAAPGGTGTGGSVNLQLKRADRDVGRATVNYTGNSHFGGSFDIGSRFGEGGQFGLRVNGAVRGGEVAVEGENRDAYVIGAGLDWRSERARLSLDLGYQKIRVDQLRPKVTVGAGLTAIPEVPDADHNYGQSWAYTELRDVFGIVHGEYDLGDDVLAYATFGARDGAEEGIYDGITVLDIATGAANGNALYVPRTDNNEAVTAGVRARVATGSVSHEINAGGSYVWQVNRNAYDFLYGPGFAGFATNLYDTPQVALPSSSLVGGDLENPFPMVRTRLGSLFVSDTLGFANDRVLLTAGLRYQSIHGRTYLASNGDLDVDYKEDAVTPVVGLVVKPSETVSLYTNRIESLAQGAIAPVGTTNAGEVFAPFKSVQYEVGGKVSIGRFNASLALFQTERPSGITVFTDSSTVPTFVVDGEQRNRGIEASVDGEVARGLRVIAGVSVTDAKLRDTQGGLTDGNKVQGVPDYTLNANVEWDPSFVPGLTLTGRVVDTGEQMANVDNSLELEGWTRFDLGARFVTLAGAKPITFRFNIDNVANKRYWASAYDPFANALLQGMPRTYKASASIDF